MMIEQTCDTHSATVMQSLGTCWITTERSISTTIYPMCDTSFFKIVVTNVMNVYIRVQKGRTVRSCWDTLSCYARFDCVCCSEATLGLWGICMGQPELALLMFGSLCALKVIWKTEGERLQTSTACHRKLIVRALWNLITLKSSVHC